MATFDICPAANLITQDFGPTTADEWDTDAGQIHAGIDLGHRLGGNRICGKPVYAPRDAEIVAMQDPHKYLGDAAVAMKFRELIEGKWVTVYLELGHLERSVVIVGQHVDAGQVVGYAGTKGISTACHLHLESRLDGPNQAVAWHWPDQRILDPARFLNFLVTPPIPEMEDDDEMQIAVRGGGRGWVLNFYGDGAHRENKLVLMAPIGAGHTTPARVDLFLVGQTVGPLQVQVPKLEPDEVRVIDVGEEWVKAGRAGHFAASINNQSSFVVEAARRSS